jgi:hypothetical protein
MHKSFSSFHSLFQICVFTPKSWHCLWVKDVCCCDNEMIRMKEFIGSIVWLPVSSSWNMSSSVLLCGATYESNSALVKWLQYHWCPITPSFIAGLWIMSIKYNNRSDGPAITTGIIAWATTQETSVIWPSSTNQLMCLLEASEYYIGHYCNDYWNNY